VSRVALSANAAAQYTVPVSEVADAFINRYFFLSYFNIFIFLLLYFYVNKSNNKPYGLLNKKRNII
jgi:hypothetical protein